MSTKAKTWQVIVNHALVQFKANMVIDSYVRMQRAVLLMLQILNVNPWNTPNQDVPHLTVHLCRTREQHCFREVKCSWCMVLLEFITPTYTVKRALLNYTALRRDTWTSQSIYSVRKRFSIIHATFCLTGPWIIKWQLINFVVVACIYVTLHAQHESVSTQSGRFS